VSTRTLGIDLSAQPKKTAACSISWHDDGVEVEELAANCDDEALLERMLAADWIGIDAPFGWPKAFVETIKTWSDVGTWPKVNRDELRFRETDRYVRNAARLPLSVSTDRIGICAMRCASLLTAYATRRAGSQRWIDRSGADQVVEVYPGAALPLWSDEAAELTLDPSGYKGTKDEPVAKRKRLIQSVEKGAPWLRLEPEQRDLCVLTDDALDAVLCALVARAAERGLTFLPETERQVDLAPLEGWIHLPQRGSLSALNGRSS
jgi:predicted nuclease with RNAse H fold